MMWPRCLSLASRIVILLLNIGNVSGQNNCTVSTTSHCKFDFGRISVTCDITDVCQLQSLLENGENLTKLDLSHNQLQVIPERSLGRYNGLELLSLAYNNISFLEFGAFFGLENLKILSLTGNPFRSFTGRLSGLFTSLETIDATGITKWKPEKTLLQLRMLKTITGFSWSAEQQCQRCSLYRLNTTWLPKPGLTIDGHYCELYYYKLNLLSPMFIYLNNTPFELRCEYNNKNQPSLNSDDYHCKHGFSDFPEHKHKLYLLWNRRNKCWEEKRVWAGYMAVLGVLTALSNLVVFVNILSSKVLRKNVTMLLVSNLALSDLFVAVYVISIGIYWNITPYSDVILRTACPKFGYFWLLGQSNSVSTSLLLTVERYLVLVFTMNPDMRISRRMAVILILMFWMVSFILTFFSLYYNLYTSSNICVPVIFSSVQFDGVGLIFSLALITLGSTFYLVIFTLYLHIYIDVKRTALNAGGKVEAKTAKLIALLVFSNLFFFVLPLIVSGVALSISGLSDLVQSHLTYSLPGISVCINSFLNPFLYAYRTRLFSNILKSRLKVCRNKIVNFVGITNRVNNITNKNCDKENAYNNGKNNLSNAENQNIDNNDDDHCYDNNGHDDQDGDNDANGSNVHNNNIYNNDYGHDIDNNTVKGDCNIENNDHDDDNVANGSNVHNNNIYNNDYGHDIDNNTVEGDGNIANIGHDGDNANNDSAVHDYNVHNNDCYNDNNMKQ